MPVYEGLESQGQEARCISTGTAGWPTVQIKKRRPREVKDLPTSHSWGVAELGSRAQAVHTELRVWGR